MNQQVKTIGLVLVAMAALVLSSGAALAAVGGVSGVGSAARQIEQNMPDCARETSGVLGVLAGVVERLTLLPDEHPAPEQGGGHPDWARPPCAQGDGHSDGGQGAEPGDLPGITPPTEP